MRVVVLDGARHRRWSGYGSLCRSAVRGLVAAGAEVLLPVYPGSEWELDEAERDEFVALQARDPLATADIALTIGTPAALQGNVKVPSVMYTQNALADLPPDWQTCLQGHRALIVPGEFDEKVFRRYYPRVFSVPQIVEEFRYRPIASYRGEVGPEPTFMYVGSYGYRKGTDILMSAMQHAFPEAPVRLRMFLGASPNLNVTDLIARARTLGPNVILDVVNKPVAPNWMARYYNQADVVVTMSRGEGWCMPLHEGLLSGVPVVAPDSTAMGAYLPEAGVLRISTFELPLAEVPDEGFRKRYETPDNAVYEPELSSAVAALRSAVSLQADLKAAALANVENHRALNQPRVFGQRLHEVLSSVLESGG